MKFDFEEQLPQPVRTALEKCFAQIRLARATELALSNRFLEAEAVLMLNGELPDRAPELDLLARIAARRARFGDARRLWKMALQKQPENEIYQQCLDRLTLARKIGRLIAMSQETLLAGLVWAAIIVGIGVLIFTFLN